MDNKNRFIIIVSAFSLLIMMSTVTFFIFEDIVKIFNMDEIVIFSWRTFTVFFSYPFLLYFCIIPVYYEFSLRMPKNNNMFIKYLLLISILGLILSIPISWYLDYKFKSLGYSVCYRLSWNAPSKYVKDTKLCN
ncbi:DUF1240 domain-containing protein [Xenorhabdus bovienii]|uniref:DUF1240 domain-containing protein n=1 Tax=Xenorhabdus bovienii str. Intermedium TaxID=1379677 RepID=A0A077QJ71_XENBV|nr:DUF1240 domain-containing protein [Xenorhabdus bovienii]MDE9452633.1 DUF1240 domain-containing protein [Xenorhabdus bovienii]MDE9481174.1 DUF1240 domain-containing protein [Xenorhabdus bovienii]MDE9542250.1 DUF1240 domain-containing protein [Xenorhabdus bovienii]MDE9555148.1 DUF1240 domain-containing protein [Xenorhabdus bovienii]MDE9563864.1 DUF1240 domain-containing protein [Xenorhabdus bovienii]